VDAHILLLDEVMSVGDEHFRRKCQDRIDTFRRCGVTILVVSHDLAAIERLCDDALWLEHGKVLALGPAVEVVAAYRASVAPGVGQASVGGMVQPAAT
jgi:lipopolysaccharide transport system ATP-binding protein